MPMNASGAVFCFSIALYPLRLSCSCTAGDVGGGLVCLYCPQVYMKQVVFFANQAQAAAGAFR